MSLYNHAKRELELVGLYDKDSDYGGMLPEAVLELMQTFEKQGHSGGSAARVIELFKILAAYKILAPIKDVPEEWNDVGTHLNKGEPTNEYQAKRISALFKKGESGRAYYLDAITWQGEDAYDSFHGTVEGVTSRQYVRFPFMPKHFVVHVARELYDPAKHDKKDAVECGSGTYVYRIKDREELKRVFEYYDEFTYGKES